MDSTISETKENFKEINKLFKKFRDLFSCQICFTVKDEDSIIFYMTCHHFFCIQCVNPGIPCVICSQTDVKEVGVQLRIKENENIRSVFHELSKYDFELKDTTDLENLIRSVEKVGKSTKLSSSPSKPEVVSKPENVNGIHTSKKVKNIAKRNYKGETSLHLACRKGNLDLVHELLQAGASSNVQDNAGWTPLHDSIAFKRMEMVKILLENGARVNTPGHENTTALHQAVLEGNTEMVKLLLKYGADKNARNIYGETPMGWCFQHVPQEIFLIYESLRVLHLTHPVIKYLFELDIIKKYNISYLEEIMVNTPAKFKSKLKFNETCIDPNTNEIILYAFNLNEDEVKMFEDFVKRFKHKSVDKLPQQTATHIIISEDGEKKITWNIIHGVLMACHVISMKWVKDSREKNEVQPIKEYEIQTDFYSGFSRSQQNQMEQLPGLFSGCHFYFGGNFELYKTKNSSFLKMELKLLVEKYGGVILTRNPDPESLALEKTIPYHAKVDSSLSKTSYYIIYSKDQWDPIPKYNMVHMKTLPIEWLLASMFKFELIDPNETHAWMDMI